MSLFEKINPEEGKAFSNYIEYYAGFDGEGTDMKMPLEYILRIWEEKKPNLFKVLGKELILTRQISFTKPTSIMEQDIWENCFDWQSKGREFYGAYNDWTHNLWHREGKRNLAHNLSRLMEAESLAKNIYDGENILVSTPDGNQIQINTGCKVSKMLGKIANVFHMPGYEDFRIAHSMCLNQKSLRGELCLSIHPLDYATMSDNECDWTSCMSWYDNGDYRQGTVEMMNSPYVVVAYLKSATDMNVGGISWSNKKWRQLYIVSPEVIVGIKQYPYDSAELNGICLQWLRDLAEQNCGWGPYANNAVEIRNNQVNTFAELDLETYMSFTTHFMYNDMYSSHLAFVSPAVGTRFEMLFSGPAECMTCGADLSDYEVDRDMSPRELSCSGCTHYLRCDECGDPIHDEYSHYIDGYYLCDYCFDSCTDECVMCEEYHLHDKLYTIYLRHNDEVKGYSIKICEDCRDSNEFIKNFGKISEWCSAFSYRLVVDSYNLTDEGFEMFGFDEDEIEEMKKEIESRPNVD